MQESCEKMEYFAECAQNMSSQAFAFSRQNPARLPRSA